MPRRNQEAEDEAYAKALQEEYRKEFLQRQAERSQSQNLNQNLNQNRSQSRSRASREETGTGTGERERERERERTNTKSKQQKKSKTKTKTKPRLSTTTRETTTPTTTATATSQSRQRSINSTNNSGRSIGSNSNSNSNSNHSGSHHYHQHGEEQEPRRERRRRVKRSKSRDKSGSSSTTRSGSGGRSSGSGSGSGSAGSRSRSSKTRSGNRTATSRGRSDNSQSASGSNHGDSQQQRRRKRPSAAGEEWLSIHHQEQQQQQQQQPPVAIPFSHHHPSVIVRGTPVGAGAVAVAVAPSLSLLPTTTDIANATAIMPESQQTDLDEQYARMVEAELRLEEQEHRLQSQRSASALQRGPNANVTANVNANATANVNANATANTNRDFCGSGGNSSHGSTEPLTDYDYDNIDNIDDIDDDDDAVIARRIQQELEDAEYAHRLGLEEQRELASQGVVLQELQQQQEQQQQEQQQQRSCIAVWWAPIVLMALMLTVSLLFVFGVVSPSDVPFFGDLFGDDWVDRDPWSGTDMVIDLVNGTSVPRLPGNAYGWATTNGGGKGGGLSLDILNACTDDYQPYVQAAIRNWDDGYPIDSLTLYSTRVEVESECSTVTGKLKICNGDYGDTRWRGLNEVLLSPRQNTIVASTAKLNEFYLNFEGDDQKIYTSCHELGHGFGLPHWDENFFNADLGNCMDYTQKPGDSKLPDESNFLYLAQLYGGRDTETNAVVSAKEAQAMAREDPVAMAGNEAEKPLVQTAPGATVSGSPGPGPYRSRRTVGLRGGSSRSSSRSINPGQSRIRSVEDSPASSNTNSRLGLSADGTKHEDGSTKQSRKRNRKRRILKTTEDFEIHLIESDEFPEGLVLLQHYLMVRD